jgi:hypothetical protein
MDPRGRGQEAGVSTADVYHAARADRVLREYAARQLAAELRCKVAPAPLRPGRVEASGPGWLLIGTPEEVRAEVLRMQEQARERPA